MVTVRAELGATACLGRMTISCYTLAGEDMWWRGMLQEC